MFTRRGWAAISVAALLLTIAAWHIENDAATRVRTPHPCPSGIIAPADCLDTWSRTQPEGESKP